MKIAITGHTSGIGKGLYDFYKQKHQMFGFSRSNGYDIDKKTDEIIEKSKNCSIFFNNAYADFSQTKLLFQLWNKWQNREKLIININSAICRTSYPYTYNSLVSKYKIHKLSLDKAVKELQQTPSKCWISQITCGFIDTDFFLYKHKIFKNKKKLSVQKVVEMADFIVSKWQQFKIHDIVIGDIY